MKMTASETLQVFANDFKAKSLIGNIFFAARHRRLESVKSPSLRSHLAGPKMFATAFCPAKSRVAYFGRKR
jgi:hypothetical protein